MTKHSSSMFLFESKTFKNKDGVTCVTRPHFATFNDKHNASRSKVYMVLWYRKYQSHKNTGLTVSQLHEQTGVKYDTIKTRIALWVKWEFLKRELDVSNGRPVYLYSIDNRGRHFVEDIIPKEWLKEYARQIREFKHGDKQ